MLLNKVQLINRTTLGVVLITLMSSCAKPLAKYAYQLDSEVLPSKITTTNHSDEVDEYTWYVDGEKVSEEKDPEIILYNSGRHDITLEVKKGKKTNKITEQVILKAPDACLVQMLTSKGDMTVQLFDETPLHRDNFIKLASSGFYDGLLYHRVINGFMIQGGDPQSKDAKSQQLGSGGPGYKIDAEIRPNLHHFKGYLAAARQGDNVNPEKKSSGSQFYIVQGKPVDENTLNSLEARSGIIYSDEDKQMYKELGGTPFLDGQYTVFGKVIKGIDVVDEIAKVKTTPRDRPLEDVKILKIIPIQ